MAVPGISESMKELYLLEGEWISDPLYRVVDRHASLNPTKLAISDQQVSLSYEDLRAMSIRLANSLEQKGFVAGDAILIQAGNSHMIPVVHLACDRAGFVFIVVSDAWREREISHLMDLSGAKVAILPDRNDSFDFVKYVASNRKSFSQLELIVGINDSSEADVSWDELVYSDFEVDSYIPKRTDPDAPLYGMVTSGTTELPRISLWTDNNLWSFLSGYIKAVELTANDVTLGIAPANTGATGYVFPVLSALLVGASSVLLKHWNPNEAIELLIESKATIATAIPTQVIKMLHEDGVSEKKYSLRVFNNAGAAMPPEKAAELEQVFKCVIHCCYGASDGGVSVLMNVNDELEKRYNTVGSVAKLNEVRLLDPDMKDVASGEVGEIVWRGPSKSFGYLNDPQRTDDAFWGDGWYRSGDLGRFDGEGYLWIVGRNKDVIIRGGQNINPTEIENLIIQNDSVVEVAVVGSPDPVFGERIAAVVVSLPGRELTMEELLVRLKSLGLAKFKMPELLFQFDELPKSAGGKIDKLKIREMLKESKLRN